MTTLRNLISDPRALFLALLLAFTTGAAIATDWMERDTARIIKASSLHYPTRGQ